MKMKQRKQGGREAIFLSLIMTTTLSSGCSEIEETGELDPEASITSQAGDPELEASKSADTFGSSDLLSPDAEVGTQDEDLVEEPSLPENEESLLDDERGADLFSSCDLPPPAESDDAQTQRGFFKDGWIHKVWGPEVKYCIEPGLMNNKSYLDFMHHVLNSTWAGVSGARYKFTGYCNDQGLLKRKKNARVTLHKQCDAKKDGSRAPACVRKGIGTRVRGVEEGVRLPVNNPSTGKNWDYQTWAGYVVHEFGHVHGFAHEQNRPGFPDMEGCSAQGSDGDVEFGVQGAPSTMLYYACGNRTQLPSLTDARMARDLFGAQEARFVDTFKFNNWFLTHSDKGPRSGVLVSTMKGQMAAIYDDEIYIYTATPENHGTHRKLSYRKIWSPKDTSYLVAGPGEDEIYRVSNDGHLHRWQGRIGNWNGWTKLSKGNLPGSMEYIVSNAGTIYAHAPGQFVVRYNARIEDWDLVFAINDPQHSRIFRTIYPSDEDGFYILHQDLDADLYLIDKQTYRGNRYDTQRIATPKKFVSYIGADQMGALYWGEAAPDNSPNHIVFRYGKNALTGSHGIIRLADTNLLIRDFFPGYDTLYVSNHRDFEKNDPDRGDWGYLYEWVQAAYPKSKLDPHPRVNPHSKERTLHKWVPYIHLAPTVHGRALLHMHTRDEGGRYAVFVGNNNGFWTIGVNTASISF